MPDITGTPANDMLVAGAGDTVRAGAGADTVTMTGGSAFGEAGDDTFVIKNLVSAIDGGEGFDTVDLTEVVYPYEPHYGFYYSLRVNETTGDLDIARYKYLGSSVYAFLESVILTAGIERVLLDAEMRVDLAGYTRSIEIVGSSASDTLSGGFGADVLRGGNGRDLITVGEGDRAYGEADLDSFLVGWTTPPTLPTLLDGGDGMDLLTITLQSDLTLTNVNDVYTWGQASITSIEQITIEAEAGATARTTTITGGNGADRFTYSGTTINGSTVTFFGGGGDDVLQVSRAQAWLYGGDGDDRLVGNGTLDGGAGNDTLDGSGVLHGGDGFDLIQGYGSLFGDAGSDQISVALGVSAEINNRFVSDAHGGDGVDTLIISSDDSSRVVSASLATGGYGYLGGTAVVPIDGFENLTGSAYGDILEGDAGANQLAGLAGADQIRAGAGDDVLDGGDGADSLYGDDGDDALIGGAGADLLSGGAGNDVLTGGAGDDTLEGSEGDDIAVFSSNRSAALISRSGDTVTIRGLDGSDTLRAIETLQFSDGLFDFDTSGQLAAEARRQLVGTGVADALIGGGSRDSLSGGDGDDVLRGGGNDDLLDGGAGSDAALYSGVRRQYEASSTVVSGNGEGADTLTSIEQARFVDGALT
ncbi:MAG: hypothetical protein KJ824_00820, partial [Alphaproteobacteria bacterium]|nr:hypothetical protein [Alphaproteobacteria bacterium]